MDYKSSGVNIDSGNEAVELIKPAVKSTHTAEVLSNIGGFAAGFEFAKDNYEKPILVSATDGVGTKLMLAIQTGQYESIGIDCVAMSVNDLICMGADPLFFLDYIACHQINPQEMKTIVSGVADGCRQAGCALIGGEMAEMNAMYKKGDFDIAGFCVGVVDKPKIIDGSTIKQGDYIYALPSSGCHSNGYSLVRKILDETSIDQKAVLPELLTPTTIYVDQINQLKRDYTIKGIANITGGGIVENLIRILPDNSQAKIAISSIKVPNIFKVLQKFGNIKQQEMFRVFNMGVGMIVVSDSKITSTDCYLIGQIETGQKGVILE